jgi:uncharacterized protein (TIGR00369 family)
MDLHKQLAQSPYHQWLGIELLDHDREIGQIRLRLPFRSDFAGDAAAKFYHGGVIASLADITATFALMMQVGADLPSIDLHVDYLRPAPAGDLLATGHVIRQGRTLGVADVQIHSVTNNKLVAIARAKISTAT